MAQCAVRGSGYPPISGKQGDSADRGDHDRRQVEAFLVAKAEQA